MYIYIYMCRYIYSYMSSIENDGIYNLPGSFDLSFCGLQSVGCVLDALAQRVWCNAPPYFLPCCHIVQLQSDIAAFWGKKISNTDRLNRPRMTVGVTSRLVSLQTPMPGQTHLPHRAPGPMPGRPPWGTAAWRPHCLD